ncbi:methionine--tRNA ligase [Marispirochaeta aestuarii]|uniref:methionine--tRNA ligase n=1 Tax=Marispirochaeta aestuarii TaxID=1963862 RepID=UPI0029C98BC8|nr:methionine--tRNA ligase [Marispirochaeta aestuarii]
MKKRLITSALPYVNNIPHLGNLIQVLSADVFARFCRLKGYETLYVCGTDEYGTATETRALEEGVSPKELCDRYFVIHDDIYKWFNIAFDKFGRTSTPEQTDIVQSIFRGCDRQGYIKEGSIEQLYCTSCQRFLADRFVRGTCPHCGYDDARGDQCENCGKLLDPTDLVKPRCGTCGAEPEVRETHHLYLDLPAILPKLQNWMTEASVQGFWARNAVQMTNSWIRDGLKERAITRDLKWGIPVPKKGYEDKVFYVWFDAPIGYISITATLTAEWETWWKDPENVELFQFIGKDNIPFHTVIFPSSLLGSGENWTLLHHMSSTEYLNYESGKFSKSKGIGVFGTDAKETGIPADVWRFYIYYNRPEKADALFTWKDFQEKVNGELIGNLGNLVNRTLTFVNRFYDGKLPEAEPDAEFWKQVAVHEEKITAHLERAELRDAFREIFALSSMGNKAFQDGEPWRTRKEAPEEAARLLRDLTFLIRDLAVLISPYIPETSDRIAGWLGMAEISWDTLGRADGITAIAKPEILFQRLEDDFIETLRERFAGSQAEREAARKENQEKSEASPEDFFRERLDLRVARIETVEQHPDADKLYVLQLKLGEEERQIVSGLVDHYSIEDLTGRHIVLVYNLKPAKLRGIKSEGMLLAASTEGEKELEVLFLPEVAPGTRLSLDGEAAAAEGAKRISIDDFFSTPMRVEDNTVMIGSTAVAADGTPVRTKNLARGSVG